jgi:hypothetical protein
MAAFFLRSAHRFFIAIDSRRLPSAVNPPRLRFFEVLPLGLPTPFRPSPDKTGPRSAVIARPSRSLSFFRSATNLSRSKVRSFGALAVCARALYMVDRYDLLPTIVLIGIVKTYSIRETKPTGAVSCSQGACQRQRSGEARRLPIQSEPFPDNSRTK